MKKHNITYCILFCLLMVVLFAPLIQQNFKPFRFAPLIGYETPTPQPAFSWKDYQSGTYQIQLEKFLSENIGFRQPIIRLYNQYVYDFYKKTYCHEVSIEKDGWLYHAEGVMEYFGNMEQKFGFTNDEVRENLADEARCLAKIQAILEEYGVHLVVFTLPTKSYICVDTPWATPPSMPSNIMNKSCKSIISQTLT